MENSKSQYDSFKITSNIYLNIQYLSFQTSKGKIWFHIFNLYIHNLIPCSIQHEKSDRDVQRTGYNILSTFPQKNERANFYSLFGLILFFPCRNGGRDTIPTDPFSIARRKRYLRSHPSRSDSITLEFYGSWIL